MTSAVGTAAAAAAADVVAAAEDAEMMIVMNLDEIDVHYGQIQNHGHYEDYSRPLLLRRLLRRRLRQLQRPLLPDVH